MQPLPSLHGVLVPAYVGTHELPLHAYEVHELLPGHAAQTPELPQAALMVPVWHVPPDADEQQPPLHAWFELHAVVHLPCAVSQAWPAGQSLALVQPHEPFARQALPLALPAQLWQTLPAAPHRACAVPGWQVPLVDDEQQPDWHCIDGEQALTHRFEVHAVELAGQSPGNMSQPHWPPPDIAMHLWPF